MVSARRALTSAQPADRELADALAGQLHNAAVRLNNGGDAPRAMEASEALALDLALKGCATLPSGSACARPSCRLAGSSPPRGEGAALDVCRLLASRDPSDAEAHTVLGEVQLSLGDNARAAQSFEEAAGADAASAAAAAGAGQAWLGQAESAAKEGRTADGARMAEVAARWLERAAELDPGRAARLAAPARARSRLSALQLRMGRPPNPPGRRKRRPSGCDARWISIRTRRGPGSTWRCSSSRPKPIWMRPAVRRRGAPARHPAGRRPCGTRARRGAARGRRRATTRPRAGTTWRWTRSTQRGSLRPGAFFPGCAPRGSVAESLPVAARHAGSAP